MVSASAFDADPLRALRAARFARRARRCAIEPATRRARRPARAAASQRVAHERVFAELRRIVGAERAGGRWR